MKYTSRRVFLLGAMALAGCLSFPKEPLPEGPQTVTSSSGKYVLQEYPEGMVQITGPGPYGMPGKITIARSLGVRIVTEDLMFRDYENDGVIDTLDAPAGTFTRNKSGIHRIPYGFTKEKAADYFAMIDSYYPKLIEKLKKDFASVYPKGIGIPNEKVTEQSMIDDFRAKEKQYRKKRREEFDALSQKAREEEK